MMSSIIRVLSLGFVLAFAGPCLVKEAAADTPTIVTTSITVSGDVEHPLTLTVDDLRKFPSQQVREVPMWYHGAKAEKLEHLTSVPLRDILDKAAIKAPAHNDTKKMVIIAGASDGYKVVFSWSEVFNTPVGDGVLVFFERDGQPLADDEGRIAMVSGKDIKTGARHVKWLQSIEVKKIVE